jgi:hypothetical protein
VRAPDAAAGVVARRRRERGVNPATPRGVEDAPSRRIGALPVLKEIRMKNWFTFIAASSFAAVALAQAPAPQPTPNAGATQAAPATANGVKKSTTHTTVDKAATGAATSDASKSSADKAAAAKKQAEANKARQEKRAKREKDRAEKRAKHQEEKAAKAAVQAGSPTAPSGGAAQPAAKPQ